MASTRGFTPLGAQLPQIRLNGGWALAVLAAVATVITARVVEWVLSLRNYRLRADYESGALSAAQYLSQPNSTEAWLGASVVAVLAQLVATVLFIVWLYLARANTELLSAAQHRLSRGWALACFLPVVNWFLPPVVLDDIQRSAHPSAPRDARPLRATSTTPLVVLWWVSFVLGSTLAFVSNIVGLAASTGEVGASRAAIGVFVGLTAIMVSITAAVLLAVIMLRVTGWQEQQAAAHLIPDPSPPPVQQPRPSLLTGVSPHLPVSESTFAAPMLPGTQPTPESELAFVAPHLFSPPDIDRIGPGPDASGPAVLSAPGRWLRELTGALLISVAAGPAVVALAAPLYPRDSGEESVEYDHAIDEWAPIMLLGLGVWALTLLLAGGAFLAWLWRARANAEILAPDGHSFGPNWAIGGWFVPLANLVLPTFVVADIHRAGRPHTRATPWLVGAWWCAWIGGWAAAWIGLNALATSVLWLAAFLFMVGAGVLIAIIRQTDNDQAAAAFSTLR